MAEDQYLRDGHIADELGCFHCMTGRCEGYVGDIFDVFLCVVESWESLWRNNAVWQPEPHLIKPFII